MESDKPNSLPENIVDSINHLIPQSEEKQLKDTVRIFRRRYIEFKNGEKDDVVLFRGDLVVNSKDKFPNSYDSLQIIDNDLENDTPVKYFKVLKKLKKIIDRDLYSDDFESGTAPEVKPDTPTAGLKKFVEGNPQVRVKTTFLLIHLLSFSDERERIIVTRYFNPFNNSPMAEVWEAHRSKNIRS